MLITAIESFVVSLPFDMGGPHPLFVGQPWDHLEILVVRVETDDNLVGWGEAFGHAAIPATKAALDTIIAPLLIGRDAGDINALTRAILHGTHLLGRNGPFVYALSAKNTAAACAQGYRHIKLHETTRDAVRAARDASGAGSAHIMLDVNCA